MSLQEPPVLTRRDQLKLKEDQKLAKNKKNEKDEDEGEVDKKRPRARGRGKAKAAKPEDAENAEEVPETAPKAKAKAKAGGKSRAKKPAKTDENTGEGEASVKPTPEPEAVEPLADDTDAVPEKTSKRRSKAKDAEPKKKSEPKKQPKRKAKAKAKSKAESEHEDDEESITTPKKRLFDDEEGDGEEMHEAGESKEDRIADVKTGEVKKLADIFNEDAPRQWKRSRVQKKQKAATSVSTLPAASSAAPAQDESPCTKKPAAKGRCRKKEAELSPFAKNEAKRRKKATGRREREIMQGGPEVDEQVQGICIQHMKSVQGLTYDEMVDYLNNSIQRNFVNFKLDPYKSRSACGLQTSLVLKEKKKTEIAYFGRSGTAPGWNESMAGWLECMTAADRERIVQNWNDPAGDLHQKVMFFKFNGNVAASKVPKKK
eukprot:s1191_g3.t1